MEMQIKLYSNGSIPTRSHMGDCWDVRAAETVDYPAYKHFYISLGFSAKLPHGYAAHIYPRSSTFAKYNVIFTNHVPIIDPTYCGDEDVWKLSLFSFAPGHIEQGSRIAQFEIVEQPPELEFKVVETLGATNRGGFGSTGV